MAIKKLLKRALDELDDVQRSLKKARRELSDDSAIRKAVRSLDEAESTLIKVLHSLPVNPQPGTGERSVTERAAVVRPKKKATK